MLETLFWILIGAFIGWNFPQPFWAVFLQNKMKEMWENFKEKRSRKY